MTRYIVNSADSHVVEPADLWTAALPENVRHLAPRYEDSEKFSHFFINDRELRKHPKHKSADDMDRTGAGGTDPQERFKHLDEDGVWGEVIFPTTGLFLFLMEDPVVEMQCARIYNDWLNDTLLKHSERFVGTAIIPVKDISAAVEETERCAKLGYRAIHLPVHVEGRPYNRPEYDPLWAAAERNNLVVTYHVGTGTNPVTERGPGGPILNYLEVSIRAQRTVAFIVAGGALERHPNLHIVVAEAGASWLAGLGERMDEVHEAHRNWIKDLLPKPPSAYLRRQVHVCLQHDRSALQTFDETGVEAILFATDYPHSEGTWPHTQKVLGGIFEGLSIEPEQIQSVCSGTMAKLFDIPEPPANFGA